MELTLRNRVKCYSNRTFRLYEQFQFITDEHSFHTVYDFICDDNHSPHPIYKFNSYDCLDFLKEVSELTVNFSSREHYIKFSSTFNTLEAILFNYK